MNLLRSFLIVLVFILIGGFFAAAELALVSLREGQVQRLSTRGRRGRRLAIVAANPNRFLAAGQVGVTLAGFISAGFGGAEIAPMIAPVLVGWGMAESWAATVSFVLVTVVIAYLSLVLGELVPKRLALQRVETVALASAGTIDVIAKIFRPFIALLSVSTNAIMRVFGGDPHAAKEQISGEELRDLVAAHEDLSVEERELIEDVFAAGDRELREVMIPRTEVEFLDGAMSVQKAAEAVLDMRHTRYPVIRGSSDNVIGFVHLRDVVSSGIHKPTRLPLSSLARDVLVFPGTKQVLPALGEMRRAGGHLAIVLDEYGGTAGIVTLEDLVEELVGDIRDEYDTTEQQSAFFGGVHEIDGLTNLEDVKDETGIELPEGPYETVAGYLIARTGQLPSLDMSVEVMGHRISVLELDGRRISRVRIEPLELRSAIPDESAALTLPE